MAPRKQRVPLVREVGSTGLKRTGGYVAADFLPKLQGMAGAKIYGEMALNDPMIGAMLYTMSSLVKNVDWQVETPSTDKAAIDAKEVLERVLFQDLRPSFLNVIEEACEQFTYGYAPMEVVWKRDEDSGWWVPTKIVLRHPETVSSWEFDEESGKVVAMNQWDPALSAREEVTIPMEKMVLFRTTSIYDNPEGQSLLRRAYVPWVRKKAIEEAEGRAALRAAGLVVLRIPGSLMEPGASGEEQVAYTAWKTLANNLAADRQGGIVIPSDVNPNTNEKLYDIEYVMADGRRPADMSPIIDRIDKRIATTVMADFLLLGQQAVGSFALSSDKTALFANALGGHVRAMAETLNDQLINRMWVLNKLDEETRPRLVPGDILSPDLGELSAYIQVLSSVGMPLFPDDNLEEYLRKVAGLPDASPLTEEERRLMAASGSVEDPEERARRGMQDNKNTEDTEEEDEELDG